MSDRLRKLERSIRKRRKAIFGEKNKVSLNDLIAGAVKKGGKKNVDLNKANILVVSHDASRTGCPILVYNIAKYLADRYNVTLLCLGKGELFQAFESVSVELWEDQRKHNGHRYYKKSLGPLVKDKQFKFAIVNSIESRPVMPALDSFGVPSVSLIHEFASYTHCGDEAMQYVFKSASSVVFSAEVVLRNALSKSGYSRRHNVFTLPQGKCEIPTKSGRPNDVDQDERNYLKSALRPSDNSERFVVIGAGFVDYRKGVDLFLEVAQKVVRSCEGKDVLFAWFGSGFKPEESDLYSMYIADQIDRSGLGDQIVMMPSTSEIDYVYTLSDALILTGRLDPLPNVAIDALTACKPVLCFDRATGIADCLKQGGVADSCVADYMDVADMASKLASMINDEEHFSQVVSRVKKELSGRFDMESYLHSLEKIALSEANKHQSNSRDIATIAEAGRLREDYLCYKKGFAGSMQDLCEFYINNTREELLVRRPEPGFNSSMFLESLHGDSVFVGDPYAEFIRMGRPAGPWAQEVLNQSSAVDEDLVQVDMAIALHIHVHYIDVLEDVFKRLQANVVQPDIYVTLTEGNAVDELQEAANNYGIKIKNIKKTPNVGRDVGAFLTGFLGDLEEKYDIVGHLHTKKSLFTGGDSVGKIWSDFIFENLLGGDQGGAMMDKILSKFKNDNSVGLIYPSDPHIMSWTKNEWIASEYAQRMGVEELTNEVNFPIGTMFWMRMEALQPFMDLNLQWGDYPVEPIGSDGTMLHALERLFGYIPEQKGWKSVVTNVHGVTR